MSEKKTTSRFPIRFAVLYSLIFIVLWWPQALLLPYNGAFRHLEEVYGDALFRLRGESIPPGDPRIILAAMDDDTLKQYGIPLPRAKHAELLDKLRSYGVKTVAFDVMFIEPREGDAELVAATRRFKNVIHLYYTETKDSGKGEVVTISQPIKGLETASQYLGYPNIDRVLDEDGHVRRAMLFDERIGDPKGAIMQGASLDAAALASFTGKPLQRFADEWGGERPRIFLLNFRRPVNWLKHELRDSKPIRRQIVAPDSDAEDKQTADLVDFSVRKGEGAYHHIKTGGETYITIDPAVVAAAELAKKQGTPFRVSWVPETHKTVAEIPSPYRTISFIDILKGELTAGQKKALRGSLVVVGSTALGYFDHYPTPYVSAAPGAEYHCNIMDNVLNGDVRRSESRLVVVLAILFMIWLPLVLLRFSPATGNLAVGGVLAAWFFICYGRFAAGSHLEFVGPAVALVTSFLVLTVHRVLTEGEEKKFIKQTFGQFVSPDVVEKLVKDPSLVKLGGEKREMTVLFLDIAHFTTISEKMAPEALILFLNKYLSALSHIIQERKGTVDKYIGDCIMAFWNAPLDDAAHKVNACLAAVECQAMMKNLNKDLDPTLPEMPAIRIGLNAGEMTVGLTGSEKKLAYTVIGDEVNLASRLEGANKFFGSHIMVSEAVFEGAREVVEARELGRVRVVGKAIPIRVYELLSKKGELPAEWKKALPRYEKGLELFRARQYNEAAVEFEEVIKTFPDDGPATFYLNTSRDYGAIPPPDDWDGVINLTAK